MSNSPAHSITRRSFLERSGKSAALFAAMTSAPAVMAANYSPNDVIGVGHIGAGVRGGQLITEVAGEPDKNRPGIPNTQVKAICEIYKGHREKGVKLSANPQVKRYHDYRDMLADNEIDAVIIATPDHWHSKMVIDAAYAGKDIYVEKCWTRTLPEAKAMYKAIKMNHTVMQLGHDRSSAAALQAAELIASGILGEVTLVQSGCYRNRERGKDEWRWYGWYGDFNRPDEAMVRQNLDWERFLGDAPYHPFSMERFWHWRCYWDYGTGIAGDLLSHSFDFVNYVLKLGIPHSCTCSGSLNLLKDGRECPDTWITTYQYPERGLTYTDTTLFNSEMFGLNTHDSIIRGKDALLKFGENNFEIYAEDTSLKYKPQIEKGEIQHGKPFRTFDPKETPEQPSHMQDFFNCMRSRQKPKDNEDEAFAEAVTCIMSVQAFFEQRTITWDKDRQVFV